MKFKSISWLMAGLLTALVSVNAWAGAVTCTPGVFSYSTGYSPTTAGNTVTLVNVNVTCVRDSTGTDGTVSYQVTFNNGINAGAGTQNIAKNGSSPLNYEFYKEATCLTKLEGLTTLNVVGQAAPSSSTVVTPLTFYACIPPTQTAAVPSVSYTDTIALSIAGSSSSPSVKYSNGADSITNSVSIIAPVTCTISTAPGTVDFGTYTSLGASAVGSTSFAANCSNTLPYTMSLDNAFGVVAGLNYSVGLTANSGATTGTTTLASTGTGVAQTFYIKGNMASGQAGSCTGGCDALKTDTRTLTITY